MSAVVALKKSAAGTGDVAAGEKKHLSVEEGVGDLFVGLFEESAKGCAGYAHLLGGLLVVKALEVG